MPPEEVVARIRVDPLTARVHEHGWQSWTPTATYRLDERPIRPRDAAIHAPPGAATAPTDAFHGAGLLAVMPAAGEPVHVFGIDDGRAAAASITARSDGADLVVGTDGPVEHVVDDGLGGLEGALARWADGYAARLGVGVIRRPPTAWCSWYHYFTEVTAAAVLENLAALDALELPIDVVQVDDGWQAGIGDWLDWSPRFGRLDDLVARIRGSGRRAGIWVAPFLVGSASATAAAHPDWLVRDADGGPVVVGRNWEQDLFALDTTHPAARTYLVDVFSGLRALGMDYVKLDFIHAGAAIGRRRADIPPLTAYREGVELVRGALGDAYLVGCGAPLLPSVGLFDAMRISPDTAPHWEPRSGDLSEPGARSAVITGAARAFQHGRFWVNDPDCLLARPTVERRDAWTGHVARFGGLRVSSDRLRELDAWGLETTRTILAEPAPARFVDPAMP